MNWQCTYPLCKCVTHTVSSKPNLVWCPVVKDWMKLDTEEKRKIRNEI